MEIEFAYAAELKKRFFCYGHFYELELVSGSRLPCRSVLEIVDVSVPREDPSAIWGMEPDAVAVMMNPGSSHPKDSGYRPASLTYPRPAGRAGEKELVLTQPDNTQYQIMRVAVSKGWRHVRVLNLSDLRDPKSAGFLRRAGELARLPDGRFHSVFCREREPELRHALRRRRSTPILLGWGRDAGLLPLAERCLKTLAAEPTVCVPAVEHPSLNAHPSPMLQRKKLEWLERISEALEDA